MAVSVKEGLEYYHTMMWPANSQQQTLAELVRLTKIPFAESVRFYTSLCRHPLRVALYFEKKIRLVRQLGQPRRLADWLAKYMFFLRLPIHDIFLSFLDSRFKVIEYWGGGEVKVMCLICPLMKCRGCRVRKPVAQPEHKEGGARTVGGVATGQAKKTLKVTLRVKRSPSGSFVVQKPDEPISKPAGKFHLNLPYVRIL